MTRLLFPLARVGFTAFFVAGAVVAMVLLWRHFEQDPWTRDGRLRADSVQVAADVSGLVTRVLVHDNQFVHAGDALFVVDRERYAAQLAQSGAAVARARATLDDAVRERQRYLALGDLVSQEVRDQRVTAAEVDRAAVAQAQADLRVARINYDRSEVRARVNGYITGLTMRPGDYVAAGTAKFALLDVNSYYVLGYFEETKLHRFQLGARARIALLGDDRPLWGHVDSMAAGIADREDTGSGTLLPNITPTFSWIRLAQRVPVRVVIDAVPRGVRLVAGRTATVTLLPSAGPIPPAGTTSSLLPNTAPVARAPTPSRPGVRVGP